MAPGTSRLRVNNHIPEDVMYDAIFTRLPYKSVTRLKTVCKNAREKIDNPTFSAKQSRMCPLCPGLIHIGRSTKKSSKYTMELLSSTPANVGVPSSRLDFLSLPTENVHFFLLGSSNGLLCICCKPYPNGPLDLPTTFHIVNPATQKAKLIPGGFQHLDWKRAVGLVFDPWDQATVNTEKFQIIRAFPFTFTHDTFVEFCFVIFSSDTGRWIMSDTRLNANIKKSLCKKAVYTHGVLYWDYDEDLIWFDVTTNKAGTIKMPKKIKEPISEEGKCHSIDVSNSGMLMCTMIDSDGLAIYEIVKIGDPSWELKHKKGWKDIVEMNVNAFQFCHSMKLQNAWQSKFHEKRFVRPLGLESGRWVYLGVKIKYKTPDRVLCYDIETGKVEDIGKELDNPYDMKPAFGYRNSMANIPPINVPASKDGICDGKPGGCICALESSEDEAFYFY